MTVLMANHAAPTGGWVPAGRSAIWDETGNLVAASPDKEEALVLGRRRARGWEGAVFPIPAFTASYPASEPEISVSKDTQPASTAATAVMPYIALPNQGNLFGE